MRENEREVKQTTGPRGDFERKRGESAEERKERGGMRGHEREREREDAARGTIEQKEAKLWEKEERERERERQEKERVPEGYAVQWKGVKEGEEHLERNSGEWRG